MICSWGDCAISVPNPACVPFKSRQNALCQILDRYLSDLLSSGGNHLEVR
jgi:hypothetical protein